MPLYVYSCEACGEFEQKQPITDEALTECIFCRRPVTRVPQPVGIMFKGTGFYCTDNRPNDYRIKAEQNESITV